MAMDPLSDVLSLLEVRSARLSRFEGRGAFAFRFGPYAAQIKFGGVLAGSFWLSAEGAGRGVHLNAGDFYLLTNGRPFRFASDRESAAIDGARAFAAHRDTDDVVRYGTRGELVSLTSGRFDFAGDAPRMLLQQLPPLIHLPADDPASRSLAGLLTLLRDEAGTGRHGGTVAETSLATLVLVHALRAHLTRAPAPRGWLGALTDARIGAALTAMHADPAQRWTVDALAREACMSRTAFAVRFRQLAGTTPLGYLTDWRMAVAQRALGDGDTAIARIAESAGYQSETAFSAAFKRATGSSPGRYRSAAQAAGNG